MIGYYKNKRKNIVKIIRSSPQTIDGYYFVKDFPGLNNEQGKIDNEKDVYFYHRNLFANKFIFDEKDIDAYLSKKNINFDFERMQKLDNHLMDIISEYLDYNLFETIEGKLFNLGELIDTSIFIFNSKY